MAFNMSKSRLSTYPPKSEKKNIKSNANFFPCNKTRNLVFLQLKSNWKYL